MTNKVKIEKIEKKKDEVQVAVDYELINDHILITNDALNASRVGNLKLFEVVRNAYIQLGSDNQSWCKYKESIECDNSSVNKILRIIKNEILMKFINNLPLSWGTLVVLTRFSNDDLVDAIETKKIDKNSTLKDVNALKVLYQGKSSNDEVVLNKTKGDRNKQEINTSEEYSSNKMIVDYSLVNIDDVSKAKNLLKKLQELGFEIVEIGSTDLRSAA